MQLKPQDVLVLLKLIAIEKDWTYRSLADELLMSSGEIHNALGRATQAHLYDAGRRRPRTQALEEFLVHGVKYAFPVQRGTLVRGIPTAHAAPPLSKIISAPDEPPPVWANANGSVRGYRIEPLFDSAPEAAKQDDSLYALLALVDAIRDGRARERKLASEHLHKLLRAYDEKS